MPCVCSPWVDLPLRLNVHLTTWEARFELAPWIFAIEADAECGLRTKCSADTFQVRSISERRLVKRLGVLPRSAVEQINRGLCLALDLDN